LLKPRRERKSREGGRGRREDGKIERLCFRMAGLGRKDEEFWKYMSNCDFLGLEC